MFSFTDYWLVVCQILPPLPMAKLIMYYIQLYPNRQSIDGTCILVNHSEPVTALVGALVSPSAWQYLAEMIC